MKNLNLNEQEKQRGWHGFCSINHANQTEVQADTLSASGRSAVSVTLEECPANNALKTRLSRANHALLPLSRCVNTLIRIGDYVVGGRARRGVDASRVWRDAGASCAWRDAAGRVWKYAAMVVLMLTLGVGEMWGDITFYYMANMPSNYWTPSNSVTMTQSSTNTNRYYSEVSLTSGTTYGFCIHEGSDVYKNNATASTNEKFQLYKYDSDNSERSSYTPSSTGTYIFTYDSGTKEIYIGPKSGAKIKIAYDVATGHDGWSNLDNYTDELTQEGTSENYYIDLDLTAQKYYMFVQIKIGDNSYAYWRGTSEITIDGNPASVFHYESNQHNNTDKLNFKPSVATRYRFTWNHCYKTIKIQRLYQVTYNANSGTGTTPESSYHLSGSTVTVAGSGSLSKSNYTFSGWNDNNDGSDTNYEAGSGTFSMPSSNKTLYAKWTQSVTLNANTSHGGSGSNRSATATWNGASLSSISHPSGATGYTCTGYFTEATGGTKVLYADGTYADDDISDYITGGKWSRTSSTTLYAQWDNHYTVTLNNQGASSVGTEGVTATYGSAMPAITVPKKTGYIFGGYYTGTNGGGTKYYNADGTSAREWAVAANTTLHAKWTGITYHVEFNANGGTGSMATQNLVYGTSTALNTNTFTRSGYYFLGWNTTADGSGTALHNGRSVTTMTSRAGQTITLYAQWAQLHTLYFVQAGCNWNPPYAYATITYDGQTYYPLETGNGTAMTSVEGGITLTNVEYNSSHSFGLFKIDNVPAGSQINFNNNSGSSRFGSPQSWNPDKPYLVYGNSTWYALDEGSTKTISAVTKMSVYVNGDYHAIDKHGSDEYAIVEFNTIRNYNYKYWNWLDQSWSGNKYQDKYIINESTTSGISETWGLNGENGGHDVLFYAPVKGEYKFKLTWDNSTPQTTICYPVGVSFAIDKNEAKAGSSTTVTLTASPQQSYLITSPTYYYQMSTDGGTNWTTIATTGETTYTHTFAATTCKFRVILQNDEGLKSSSDAQDFTAYSTKSFYVYNPYNNSSDKWQTLHLYTYDSNDGNKNYNGSWPGQSSGSCEHGNAIVAKGGNWYYITIDERANYFQLVGDGGCSGNASNYDCHKTTECEVSNYIQDGKYMIETVNSTNYVNAYKAKGASDFRLKYTDASGSRYTDIYNTTLDGTEVMASMWMNAADGTSTLTIEKGTGSDTWGDAKVYSNSDLKTLIPDTKEDHGYVFQMKVNFNTETPASSTITEVKEYTGPFYVRTDGLNGGWNDYKKADHLMVKSEASLTAGSPAYNYYLCKWTLSGTSVKFTVANDYNKELVASLSGDANSTEPLYGTESLPANANVRFAWNSQTNTLTRAYLSGSSNASDRFLVMTETGSTGKIYNENGVALTGGGRVSGLSEHELLFADNGNWVYQLVMQAQPGAQADVTAKYNDKEQDFMTNVALIGGEGDTKHTYRITYDFKTNVLTNAWVPDATINTNIVDLNSNVMLIRNGQDAAEELKFGGNYSITGAKKLISVMQFDYDNMVGRMGSWNSQAYQYCMYYISFPFDVNVSDIFGIGTYGTDWKLQYYDGAERASKGFFRGDGTTTFWKDVPANGKLDKYVGYSLLLNRIKFNDSSSDIWENKGAGSSVYLYFPSNEDAGTIKSDTYELVVPEHECTLPQSWTDENGRTHYHSVTDSHWNMIGVPILANSIVGGSGLQSILGSTGDFRYLYEWNYGDNSLSVAKADDATFTFHAMKSYMVQFHGSINFTGAGIYVAPAASVAARKTAEKNNYSINLQVLNADEQEINHTYVKMEEGADADFALNEDLCMVTNNRAVNIYTFAGSYDVAANVLPVENTTIPVGLTVKTAGSYIIAMPSNFDGTVTLVDTYAQTRTNLALEDYEVQLEKGTFNDRFYLELDIRKVPTAIDGVTDGNGSLKDGKAHKFIENGIMYLMHEGTMYDVRGNKVK